MSSTTRTGAEAILAIVSIATGVAGAALVQPVVLGVAAAVAVVATVMRLTDKAPQAPNTGATDTKAKIVG